MSEKSQIMMSFNIDGETGEETAMIKAIERNNAIFLTEQFIAIAEFVGGSVTKKNEMTQFSKTPKNVNV